MPADVTQQIFDQILQLPRHKKIEMLALLERDLLNESDGNGPSLMQLQGLGKEVWAEVDVQQYLRNERDSWSG